MSLFVLDTDMLTLFQKVHTTIADNVAAHPIDELATTVISVEEQLSGWYTFIRKAKQINDIAVGNQSLADSVAFLSAFRIVTYDVRSIHRFQSFRQLKLNIRKNDLRIAAIVLENGAALDTRNARDFQQIPGLVFVDWSV